METALLLLKLAGITLSAAFGILGTVHEFRDKSGRLTRWGLVSIGGVVLSALVAVTAQFIEEHRERNAQRSASIEALASTRRLERIVTDLGRSLQPLETASVWLQVQLPMDDPAVKEYKKRLDKGVASYLAKHPEKHFLRVSGAEGISAPVIGLDGKPTHVNVSSKSTLYPVHLNEVCASSAFSVMHLELAFYKLPIEPRTFYPRIHGAPPLPDLQLNFNNFDRLDIQKDLAESQYLLTGLFSDHIEGWERSTGNIVSIKDLSDAQMFLTFDRPVTQSMLGIKVCPVAMELRSKFEIDNLNVTFGKRELRIKKEQLKKHVGGDGMPYWEYRFRSSAF